MHQLALIFIVLLMPFAVVADPVEDLFAARGPYETTSDLSTGPNNGFSLFRPASPGADGELHPVITWGNGTFSLPLFYFDFLDHLASHGFIVVAANDLFTGSGDTMLQGVDWILDENANPASALFENVDVGSIGATGHSQGGQGTINAGNDARIKCTAPIEPVPGNVEGLQGPMFVVAGQNDNIVPAPWVAQGVAVPSTVPTVFGILQGATHFDALGDAGGFRGYVTAWFSSCLSGDQFARTAFGAGCSLCDNENWQVFRKAGQ